MRQFIAYLCLTIFSFQVLPVKEIGKMLYKGLITEEEVAGHGHAGNDGTPLKLKKDGDPLKFYSFNQHELRIGHLTHDINIAVHHAEFLPLHFVADIVTPPPNIC